MWINKYIIIASFSSFFFMGSTVFAQTKAKPVAPKSVEKVDTKVTPIKKSQPVGTVIKKPSVVAPITVGSVKKRDVIPKKALTKEPKVSSNELKLRMLAQLVEDLKNKVTATKYRLQLLKEAMTSDTETVGGAKIKIIHNNKMGGVFRLIRIRYFLDGKLIQSLSAVNSKDKVLLSKKNIDIFSDHVTPGNKRVRVFITYQGNGYGVFNYVKKWKWEVHNTYSFPVTAGKMYTLKIIGKEKGGFTTPLAKRPQIKFKLQSKSLVSGSSKNKKSSKKSK
jgi:hypothetical protein